MTWEDIYTTNYCVLANSAFSGSLLTEARHLKKALPIQLKLEKILKKIFTSLEAIEKDSKVATILTPDGLTPTDLRIEPKHIDNFQITILPTRNLFDPLGAT
jgi:hypothetical protein